MRFGSVEETNQMGDCVVKGGRFLKLACWSAFQAHRPQLRLGHRAS